MSSSEVQVPWYKSKADLLEELDKGLDAYIATRPPKKNGGSKI